MSRNSGRDDAPTDNVPSMRILHVVDSLAPGGAETSLAELLPAISTLGVDSHVAYLVDRRDLADKFRQAGAHLWPLTGRRTRLGRALAVRRLCRSLHPDLVHTTLFEADVAGRVGAWLARVPVVSSIVNEMYGPAQRNLGLKRARLAGARLLDASTAQLAHRFHAISATVADVMAPRLWLRRDYIEVIHRARDPDGLGSYSEARRATTRDMLGIHEKTPLVIAVARLEPQKGLDVLLDAVPAIIGQIPDVQVLLIGRPGSQSGRLDEMIRSLGLRSVVRLLGARSDVADLMVAADVLAFPSRWEGFGGTLLEAMALECPVVCSDLPVLREIAGACDSVKFVPVDDPSSLAAAIVGTIRIGRNIEAVKNTRAHFLRNYTTTDCAASMLHFYRSALDDIARAANRS